ncbi:hypothetical protein LTR28_014125, partial [Elasticomyces elasticus]
VSFYFQVDSIEPSPWYPPRHDRQGEWLPPRPRGSNMLVRSGTTGLLFYGYGYGTGPQRVQRVPSGQIDQHSNHYKTFSVYMNQSAFWIFPGDATTSEVGTGQQQDSAEEYDEDTAEDGDELEGEDWSRMNFYYPTRNLEPRDAAYATFAGEDSRMRFQHREQLAWINRLLPDRYHAEHTHISTTGTRAFGGLIGELPMIIALIAFSVRSHRVVDALQYCMVRPRWRSHPRAPREGWTDQRGMVVRVFHNPQDLDTRSKLPDFERGQYGKMFDVLA